MDAPLQSTLAEKAYLAIRGKLGRGELRPGDRLVNRSLAADIGVCFTPVREAINQLASEGLVEYVRGAGAYVRRIDRRQLEQLFDLRDCLEPFAARQAADHIDSEELREAHRLCTLFHALARELRDRPDQTADAAQWHRWIELEERFHGLVFHATRNPWVLKIAGELRLIVGVGDVRPMARDLVLPAPGSDASVWRARARKGARTGARLGCAFEAGIYGRT